MYAHVVADSDTDLWIQIRKRRLFWHRTIVQASAPLILLLGTPVPGDGGYDIAHLEDTWSLVPEGEAAEGGTIRCGYSAIAHAAANTCAHAVVCL